MTEDQKTGIRNLRERGMSYKEIAESLCLTKAQVAGFCRRNSIAEGSHKSEPPLSAPSRCKNCGAPIAQKPGQKLILFCSDNCCQSWWNSHPEAVRRRQSAVYHFTCAHCGKPFTAYGNSHRKYCSHACYIAERFKGGDCHK